MMDLFEKRVQGIKRAPFVEGVYFLKNKGKIVYIGQSNDIFVRIYSGHKTKAWDTIDYLDRDQILEVFHSIDDAEAFFILTYLPLLNTDVPKNSIFIGINQIKKELSNKLDIRLLRKELNIPSIQFKGIEYYKREDFNSIKHTLSTEC